MKGEKGKTASAQVARYKTKGTGWIYVFITILALICFLPMWLLFTTSITDSKELLLEGVRLFPQNVSLEAYRYLLTTGKSTIVQSYAITIYSTLVGTVLAVIMTAAAGYALSCPHLKGTSFFALYFFITMLFSGGMVPWYMINKKLGLDNNFWALVVPSLMFSPYNMFLVRNYMKGLPISMAESARIDGASEFVIAWKIFIPLSVPVLATVTLFYALGYWNSWWNAVMLVEDKELFPLQYMLVKIRSNLKAMQVSGAASSIRVPTQPVQNAITLATIGPILLLYPFLQRYFIKGIVIGAVKG